MNIVLMGYMGSGKSLIGKELAKKLNFKYLDLDDFIEVNEKKSISNIFKEKGEIYFRKKESQYLKEVLETYNKSIISLGGGTPCFAGNLEILKQESITSIYLHTSIDALTKRLLKELGKRPLISHLQKKEDLKDFISKHLFERSFYYNQGDFKVVTDAKSINQITGEILSLLS